MASPVPVPPSGSGPLDQAPPPSSGPTGPTPGPEGGAQGAAGAVGGAGAPDPQGGRRAVVLMGAEIDRALTGLAQGIQQLGGQEGLRELAQARQLIEAGIAKFVAKGGQAPATSPVSAGPQFPGGGANSGAIS